MGSYISLKCLVFLAFSYHYQWNFFNNELDLCSCLGIERRMVKWLLSSKQFNWLFFHNIRCTQSHKVPPVCFEIGFLDFWSTKPNLEVSGIGEYSAKKLIFFPCRRKNCEKLSPYFSLSEVKNFLKLLFFGKNCKNLQI